MATRAIDELLDERPEWPYARCPRCRGLAEEHDENGRCHDRACPSRTADNGCGCGVNPW